MSDPPRVSGVPAECERSFDESLLTGYVDQVLTQAEEQRVRVHLEDCALCRALVEEFETMRKATMRTDFEVPSDEEWGETPSGTASGLALGVGWLIVAIWTIGLAVFALVGLWQGTQSLLEKLLIFGGASGFALLFVSVLIDRLRSRQTDRYRRVEK